MKNDFEMYQSVLSRRDAYREKKARRIRTVRRTVPVLACCCLAAVLGLGYRNHLKELPEIPAVQVGSEISGTELPVTTAPAVTEPGRSATAAARTEKTAPASAKSTETVTVTEPQETALSDPETTQADITAPPVTQSQTKPLTQTKPHTVTTEEPGAPEPPAVTTEEPGAPKPQSPQKEEPGTPQAQPLMYPDIEAAAKAVIDAAINGNCPGNDAWEKGAYTSMFGSIMHNGYLYQVSSANGITRQDDRGITLLPDARYEDIGAACRAVYQGQSYYVAFHYADYRGLTMPEYLQRSMEVTPDKNVTVNGETVCLRFADNGQITAYSFIERNDSSDVYYTVRAAVSETEMLDFLNAMQYEKISVYDYWIL